MTEPTSRPSGASEEPAPTMEIGCPHGAWGMVVSCPHCGTPRHVSPSQHVSDRFLSEVERGEREWPEARAGAASTEATKLPPEKWAHLDDGSDPEGRAAAEKYVESIERIALDALAATQPPADSEGSAEPWKVHNHGPHEGRGTACREYHLNGRLVGACKIIEATSEARAASPVAEGGLREALERAVRIVAGKYADQLDSRPLVIVERPEWVAGWLFDALAAATPPAPEHEHDWDCLKCADMYEAGLVAAATTPPAQPLPTVDPARLRAVVRDLTDEHGWPKSAVGSDAFIDAIVIEYDRLSRLSEAREPLTYEFRHDESGYAALSPEGGSETLEQRRIRNAPEHSEEGWSR